MIGKYTVLLAVIMASFAAPIMADEPTPKAAVTCPDEPVIPAEWSGWKQATAQKSMSEYSPKVADRWPVLDAMRTGLALHPIDNVQYWATPETSITLRTYGGMNPIKVMKAGRLKIALDSAAWMDLVRSGAPLKSVAHGHGPDCSGIRKIVEFDVQPGTYLLQIANAPNASIGVMAVQPK